MAHVAAVQLGDLIEPVPAWHPARVLSAPF
jgi:hypothetical protein